MLPGVDQSLPDDRIAFLVLDETLDLKHCDTGVNFKSYRLANQVSVENRNCVHDVQDGLVLDPVLN